MLNLGWTTPLISKARTVSNGTGCADPSADEAARIQLLTRKIEVVSIIEDFHCTVTSTWTNNEDNREFHTWWAWGSGVRKIPLDYIMGPKGHTGFDVVPEPGEVPYLGSLPCDYQD